MAKTEPLLIDVPERLKTQSLILRVPRAGDGATVCASIRASLPELKVWMPWAKDDYGDRDGEEWCRKSAASFIERKDLQYMIWASDNAEYLGAVGTHAFDWDVPKCEIGYWLRTSHCGRGLMTEAVNALAGMLLGSLEFQRVEIRCDDRNQRSWRVAERCGFTFDGTLRRDHRYSDGRLRDTRVYSRLADA
jgi:ribosomal-protein-serine acetyltransferase